MKIDVRVYATRQSPYGRNCEGLWVKAHKMLALALEARFSRAVPRVHVPRAM